MKTIKTLSILLVTITGTLIANVQTTGTKPTIIFVHGIWADGSCWASEITDLQAKGYPVISVQNPVTSLADDVAATKRAIAMASGNVILVGHSWGGFVITQAGNDHKVVGLVYIAAFAPDSGETVLSLSAKVPANTLATYFVPQDGFMYLSKKGIETIFAQDLMPKQQALIYATQVPASQSVFVDKSGEPAWKAKASWYIVAKNDGAISPDLERLMAKRMNAKTIELESSHVVMITHPKEVIALIEDAANAVLK
ncbi:alpha/beta hydrolase [Mucilaginibacter sp. X4EP1]|uniref:alpha/beta hydrolase n=1 Tax=Mucilaginibacter sp. X4EP1 TaxID=2723092 RepID=UPI002167C1CF|nr:alpha/beta hydrolase [Mucilaginibacter sp. X4EP1]MCS3813454.1 pimeloyl-ACP methyl ester carboxylesterase [Mucilaginibacter sp. X4EP1]